jgi:uncharacterized protein YjbI with pentapeptide repeats
MDLQEIQIPRADLSAGVFYQSNLRGSNLTAAKFYGAMLDCADLSGSNL